jgi:hypothetical protein
MALPFSFSIAMDEFVTDKLLLPPTSRGPFSRRLAVAAAPLLAKPRRFRGSRFLAARHPECTAPLDCAIRRSYRFAENTTGVPPGIFPPSLTGVLARCLRLGYADRSNLTSTRATGRHGEAGRETMYRNTI